MAMTEGADEYAPREQRPEPDPTFPDLEIGEADHLRPDLLRRFRAVMAEGGDADRVTLSSRVPAWMNERLDSFLSRYNALRPHATDKVTKQQFVTELLLLGMAAYPLPPTSEEAHY
jgi:hypothetical protein